MAHYIRYLAPSLTPTDFPRVARALGELGSSLNSGDTGDAVLHLTVRSLTGDAGTFLEIDADNAAWDLGFARTLSAEIDGFVSSVEYDSVAGHYGEALFFAGRTLQARSWKSGATDIDYGPPRMPKELLGVHVQELYNKRFEALCDPDRGLLSRGTTVASEDWDVTPSSAGFGAKDETGFALVLLGNATEEFRERLITETAIAGWRRRLRYTRGLALPYVEMRRDGSLDPGMVGNLSRHLCCTAVGIEVPGAARPFHCVSAYEGTLEATGEAHAADDFVRCLYPLSSQLGEPAGMLFGFGNGGWQE